MSGCKSCGFHIVDPRSGELCSDCYFDELDVAEWREPLVVALGRAFIMRDKSEEQRERMRERA